MHALLITTHAVAAAVALLAGLVALRHPRAVGVHAVGTVLMTAALGAALWVGRAGDTSLPVPVSGALLVLAVVMSWRSARAWWVRPATGAATSAPFVAAVGFTCTSLTTGLLVVAAVRAEQGPVAVVTSALLPVLLGRVLLERAVRRRRLR